MAAEKPPSSNAFFANLLSTGIYKRTQGRIARQVTFFAILIGVGLGAWRWSSLSAQNDMWMRLGLPGLILLLGGWIAYRLVNMPNFADFLIAVEAEMSKVSWPTRGELVRGSIVVLLVIFILTTALFLFDIVWSQIFKLIGIQ